MFGLFKKSKEEVFQFIKTITMAVIVRDFNSFVKNEKQLDFFAYTIFTVFMFQEKPNKNPAQLADNIANILLKKYGNNSLNDLRQSYSIYMENLDLILRNQKTPKGLDPAMALGFDLLDFIGNGFDSSKINVITIPFTIDNLLNKSKSKIKEFV